MMHVLASALDYHLYHSFFVLQDEHMSTITGPLSVLWKVINGFLSRLGGFGFQLTRRVSPCSTGKKFPHVNQNIPQLSRR